MFVNRAVRHEYFMTLLASVAPLTSGLILAETMLFFGTKFVLIRYYLTFMQPIFVEQFFLIFISMIDCLVKRFSLFEMHRLINESAFYGASGHRTVNSCVMVRFGRQSELVNTFKNITADRV